MSLITHRDITDAIESVAPRRLQEDYDNTGYQTGNPLQRCTGVLLCVDLTTDILDEAVSKGCNLVITHHPLLFRATKSILPGDRVNDVLIEAIKRGVTVYSCHTSIDNTPVCGVSWQMAKMLGLKDVSTLTSGDTTTPGAGAIGTLPVPLTHTEFVSLVKKTFNSPVARCSHPVNRDSLISRVALCGGAGGDFIPDAVKEGADAYVTSDCKHNMFIDLTDHIFLVDIGHFESEECTKQIFCDIISKKFANFAVCKSQTEKNPINYL